jgi:hypothetical protein
MKKWDKNRPQHRYPPQPTKSFADSVAKPNSRALALSGPVFWSAVVGMFGGVPAEKAQKLWRMPPTLIGHRMADFFAK